MSRFQERLGDLRAELNPWRVRGRVVERRADACGAYLIAAGKVRISRGAPHTRLTFGDGVYLFEDVGFFLDGDGASIEVGDGTGINRRTEVVSEIGVRIGSYCLISWDVLITDTDYHVVETQDGPRPVRAPVVIEDSVWIGIGARVLKGVTVGEGAIVAAGATVTRDVPPHTLVAGTPARVLREGVRWR